MAKWLINQGGEAEIYQRDDGLIEKRPLGGLEHRLLVQRGWLIEAQRVCPGATARLIAAGSDEDPHLVLEKLGPAVWQLGESEDEVSDRSQALEKRLRDLHSHGLVHGDVSANNILSRPHTREWVLIDPSPDRANATARDDMMAFGRAVLSAHWRLYLHTDEDVENQLRYGRLPSPRLPCLQELLARCRVLPLKRNST